MRIIRKISKSLTPKE
jgi:hypothetical protein